MFPIGNFDGICAHFRGGNNDILGWVSGDWKGGVPRISARDHWYRHWSSCVDGENMPPEEWRPFQNQGQIWNKHNSELKFSCVRQASKGCVYPFSTTIQYFQIKYTLFSQRNTKFHDFWIWIFLFIYKLALPATFDLCRRKKIAMTWKKNIYIANFFTIFCWNCLELHLKSTYGIKYCIIFSIFRMISKNLKNICILEK